MHGAQQKAFTCDEWKDGRTPLALAKTYGKSELEALMVKYGAKGAGLSIGLKCENSAQHFCDTVF